MKLPPYNKEAKCPKCGHHEVHRQYCDEGGMIDNSYYPPSCHHAGIPKEHLHRVCTVCKYEWLEEVLDES